MDRRTAVLAVAATVVLVGFGSGAILAPMIGGEPDDSAATTAPPNTETLALSPGQAPIGARSAMAVSNRAGVRSRPSPGSEASAVPRGARSIAASSAPPAIETALEWAAPLSRSRAPADRGRITPILLHPRQPPAAPVPKIAIVIDDLGHNRAAAERAIALDRAVTLAFLPDAEAAAALAAEARAAGHEVLLHMPMEPIAGAADPGPNALRVGLVPAEVRRRLGWALSRVPGAIGLNNHMGSKFTADGAGMALVLVEAKERGLLFLDSRTTADSVGFSAAARIGLRRAARDVFLDNEVSTEAVAAQLAETERIATAQGSAIAIGHPHPATLAVLESWLPGLANRGFLATPITAVATADDPLLAESHQP